MRWTKRIRLVMIIGAAALALYGCSSGTNQFTPEQVISNALKESSGLETYYGEAEMILSEKDKELERETMKEWRSDDGKIKMESKREGGKEQMIVVNDGQQITAYQVDKNQAFIVDDPEILSINQPSPKEQAKQLLGLIQDTHEISTKEEEQVAGRETYHLFAKAKEDNTLLGDQELWIDKQNWMVLKMISRSGDIKTEVTYTKLTFGETFPENTFTLDLPEDVEIQDLEDMSKTTELTLDEAANKLEKPWLYFPETEELKIAKIEMNELHGELKRIEVDLDYEKNGLPFLELSVFESDEGEEDDLKLPGETSLNIRNQEASYVESGDFRLLTWQENGVSYLMTPIDPKLTLDELKRLTEAMEIAE